MVAFSDIELGVVSIQHELGQCAAFAKADHSAVDNATTLSEVKHQFGIFSRAYCGTTGNSDLQHFIVFFSDDEDALHGGNVAAALNEVATIRVHHIEVAVVAQHSGLAQGVTHEVPAREVAAFALRKGDRFVVVRNTCKLEGVGLIFGSGLLGIEVALARNEVESSGFIVTPFIRLRLVEGIEVEVAFCHTCNGGRIHVDGRSDEVVAIFGIVIGIGVDGEGVDFGGRLNNFLVE